MKLYDESSVPIPYLIDFRNKLGIYCSMLHKRDLTELVKSAFIYSRTMENKSVIQNEHLITDNDYRTLKYHGFSVLKKLEIGKM